MNLNSNIKSHQHFVYVATNTFIPDFERTIKSDKLRLSKSHPEDSIYAKYICINCSPRKMRIAKKEPSNPHFGCTKKCCPLPYHWNLCESCIKNQHFPIKVNDEKRRMDALKFQQIFSKLPEDVQELIREYIPMVFAFVKISSRLFLEKTLRNGSRELSQLLRNLPSKVMMNLYGALVCVDFAKIIVRTTRENKRKYIRQMATEFYEYMTNTYRSTIICDEDYWKLRMNNGVRYLLKRSEILEHIKTILCPTDIRKYFIQMSESASALDAPVSSK